MRACSHARKKRPPRRAAFIVEFAILFSEFLPPPPCASARYPCKPRPRPGSFPADTLRTAGSSAASFCRERSLPPEVPSASCEQIQPAAFNQRSGHKEDQCRPQRSSCPQHQKPQRLCKSIHVLSSCYFSSSPHASHPGACWQVYNSMPAFLVQIIHVACVIFCDFAFQPSYCTL